MRTVDQTVEWYRTHEQTAQIGFNPDGMCQKIVRTARGIGSGAPSALASQHATPQDHRVYDVEKIERGMVVYYDAENDGNPYGHVVTVVGRDPHRDPDDLGSLLVRTNSVQAGRVVVVRGDYFGQHWGDPYKFAGTWLNGEVLTFPERKPPKAEKPPMQESQADRLWRWVDVLDGLEDKAKRDGKPGLAAAFQADKRELRETIQKFS